MFFTYILLSIGMYSLQRQRPQVVEISPVVNTDVVKNKQKKSESVITETDQINTGSEENDIVDINNQEGENEYDYDPELYEEISFEDNFDKEYRDDVGDSYFEDLSDHEDIQEVENYENTEVAENDESVESTENSEIIENILE